MKPKTSLHPSRKSVPKEKGENQEINIENAELEQINIVIPKTSLHPSRKSEPKEKEETSNKKENAEKINIIKPKHVLQPKKEAQKNEKENKPQNENLNQKEKREVKTPIQNDEVISKHRHVYISSSKNTNDDNTNTTDDSNDENKDEENKMFNEVNYWKTNENYLNEEELKDLLNDL